MVVVRLVGPASLCEGICEMNGDKIARALRSFVTVKRGGSPMLARLCCGGGTVVQVCRRMSRLLPAIARLKLPRFSRRILT